MKDKWLTGGAAAALLAGGVLGFAAMALAGAGGGGNHALVDRTVVVFDDAVGQPAAPTRESGPSEAQAYAPDRHYAVLGGIAAPASRGNVVLYSSTQVCDPNDVNFVTFDGLLQSSLIQNCLTNGNRMGCSGVCPPVGPLYFQDSGTTIAADATSYTLVYGSDQGGGAVDPDHDADGDVDLGDFG